MPKNALFLFKNRRALGAPPPDPLLLTAGGFALRPLASGVWAPRFPFAFGVWGLRSQTLAIAPFPHNKFLATRLVLIMFKNLLS